MKKLNLVYKIVLFIILLLPISNVAQTKNPEGDDTSESIIFISDEPESSVNYHGRYKITA